MIVSLVLIIATTLTQALPNQGLHHLIIKPLSDASSCFVNITTPAASYAPMSYSDAILVLETHNNARNGIRYATSMPLLTWSSELSTYVQSLLSSCQIPSTAAVNVAGFAQVNFVTISDVAGTPISALVPQFTNGQSSFSYTSSCSAAGGWCGSCSDKQSICMTYTQVIWATTLQLGCSTASCSGRQYLLCAYGPAGNVAGQPPYQPSVTPLVGCQYQSASSSPDTTDRTTLYKVLAGIGAGILALIGGISYFYMDGGCDAGGPRRDRQAQVGGTVGVSDADRKMLASEVPMNAA